MDYPIVSHYLSAVLTVEGITQTVHRIIHRLKNHDSDFDGIAFRGMSGALVAPLVAREMRKKLLMVRKAKDSSHSMHTVEGDFSTKQYVIIDDMISSGNTLRGIIEDVKKDFIKERVATLPECVGIVLYKHVQEGCKQNSSIYNSLRTLIGKDFFFYGVHKYE